MILENRTRYRSADLEKVIHLALAEHEIAGHARERVIVIYGKYFSGFCRYPWAAMGSAKARGLRTKRGHAGARMVLRLPRPEATAVTSKVVKIGDPDANSRPTSALDLGMLVWLVRHEIDHWRGLRHSQMHPAKLKASVWRESGSVLPAWAADCFVGLEEAEPVRARKTIDSDADRADRIAHAEKMMANADAKERRWNNVKAKWKRRIVALQRAQLAAAARPR